MDFYDDIFEKAFKVFGVGFSVTAVVTVITSLLSVSIVIAIVVMIIKSIKKDNNSPRLAVAATVVSKRTRISQSHRSGHTHAHMDNSYYHSYDSNISTFYYVTFQFESGDRVELCVPCYEYGLLIEGDRGILSFQGSRYLSFERN